MRNISKSNQISNTRTIGPLSLYFSRTLPARKLHYGGFFSIQPKGYLYRVSGEPKKINGTVKVPVTNVFSENHDEIRIDRDQEVFLFSPNRNKAHKRRVKPKSKARCVDWQEDPSDRLERLKWALMICVWPNQEIRLKTERVLTQYVSSPSKSRAKPSSIESFIRYLNKTGLQSNDINRLIDAAGVAFS